MTAHPTRLLPRLGALLLGAGLVAGCGAPAPSPTAAPSSATGAPTASAPAATEAPTASDAPTGAPTATPEPTGGSAGIVLEEVVTGLDSPIWVSGSGDGSGRLFVAEQTGRIREVRDGSLVDPPFLDITDRVNAGGERGLLGVAFPPRFGHDRPFVYVHYSAADGSTTISEFTLAGGSPDALDPGSEHILMTVPQPYPNHNGGWIGFDPFGMLLIALGDGGAGGDPENRASNLGEPLGKILRIDVTHAEEDRQYAIPDDNPFIDDPDALPEIFHYGLRNPFRAGFDSSTGDLWIGDVGQGAWEEVDVARAGTSGLDFGWRRWEGLHCFNPSSGCDPAGVTPPVAEYGHGAGGGCSVIGGVVYHGDAIPALRDRYLFSDYCSGTLWTIDPASDGSETPEVLLETGASISSVSTDDDGEVYLTDLGGRLLRVVEGG